MTGIVIHKGPKPLIPSMTESAGEVGVGGALWIPDEFNQGGSIRPGRGERGRQRRGGQGRLILKGFLPPAAPVFPSEYLFFSTHTLLFLSFICRAPSFQPHAPPLCFPLLLRRSLLVSSSLTCRSPERATLAKQGIWRSEANLLWEVNTGDFCCPSNKCSDFRVKVSTRHIQSIVC